MDWSTDALIRGLNEQTVRLREQKQRGLSSIERHHQALAALQRALGAFPETKIPLEPQLLERREYDDFYLERIAYGTMEHVNVPVMVLIPKFAGAGPWPAVLACHGHGSGQHEAIGMDQSGSLLEEPGIHNRFAVQLVRKGMLVVVPEIMGFGVRRMSEEKKADAHYNSCPTLSAQLLANGRTLAGMRVYEAMRALDYLQGRDDVQQDRIGIFGFSGGGLIAAYTAALDERVRATVLCGWVNTFAGSILAMRHCIDNYLPGIALEAEQPDLIGLIAPRALFVEAGEQDQIFPIEYTVKALAELRETYIRLGAEEKLASDIHKGGHQISGESSVDWLYERLMAEG